MKRLDPEARAAVIGLLRARALKGDAHALDALIEMGRSEGRMGVIATLAPDVRALNEAFARGRLQ